MLSHFYQTLFTNLKKHVLFGPLQKLLPNLPDVGQHQEDVQPLAGAQALPTVSLALVTLITSAQHATAVTIANISNISLQ